MKFETLSAFTIRRANEGMEVLKQGGHIDMLKAGRLNLIVARMEVRDHMNNYLAASEKMRFLQRESAKLKKQGIVVTILEAAIEKQKIKCKNYRNCIKICGESICTILDLWQNSGATLKDLCSLCNRNYDQVMEEISVERQGEKFSAIMFIHNLDYPPYEKGDFLKDEVDAPFTHAVKEHMLDLMLNTPEGKVASNEALKTVFPELWDAAVMKQVDEDGNVYYTDTEGNILDLDD